ncbi:MAG: shikimate kinase [Bacteroidetes bacterium]|nr:shikimate kinase [Bacteroidota bacterium]MDA0879862.1 shikimate kinase [Bacteroidota bacterium]MDA1115850.1 shikimate kinase [Bacteroidota bacterium]
MKIILCGYMGSGKSAVGLRLSKSSSMAFLDLDQCISEHESRTVSEIFSNSGELYFRRVERQVLENVLSREGNTVIALGGGTPCYGDNTAYMLAQPQVKIIYLKANIQTIVKRLESSKQSRPLLDFLKDSLSKEEFIAKHLFERSFYYEQSHQVVAVDDKSLEEVTAECLQLLQNRTE